MGAGFHDDEASLWDGLQLVRRQQSTLHHLQALAGVVLATAHGARQNGAAAESFGQGFRSLTVGSEAAKNGILS